MDLVLEPSDNKGLVVIRSSSCVIRICQASSVFKSCNSDTSSASQVTRISNGAEPSQKAVKHVEPNLTSTRKDVYSGDKDESEQYPAHASRNEKNGSSLKEVKSPSLLPYDVLKLIEPSVKNVAPTGSSHRISKYDMIQILIQVVTDLKSDCRNIFGKRENGTRDENAVKLIIRECFTEIMVRYSTDTPSFSERNSYNRCHKIISRSIKSLTVELVDIIERAIHKQATVMRSNREERENAKSLLIKLMQTIQTELDTSKPVLKVVNTELHRPSFQFIFALLRYFIEKSALGFKRFCQKSPKRGSHPTGRIEGAGEDSGSRCDVSIAVSKQKLDEYASRLDRLLEKASKEQYLHKSPKLVIDCYHCFTKCKEQDLLLKTVTRFTEEIKQELINHAVVIPRGCHYRFSNPPKKRSREICSPETSIPEPLTWGIQRNFRPRRSSSSLLNELPVRNALHQSKRLTTPFGSRSKNLIFPCHNSSSDYQRNSSHILAQITHTNKICSQHQRARNNPAKLLTKWETNRGEKSRTTSPTCLHHHKIPFFECATASKSPGGQKHMTRVSQQEGSATAEDLDECRYCTPSQKPCAYDSIKIEEPEKNIIAHDSLKPIHYFNAIHERLPKPPVLEKNRVKASHRSNEILELRIVPKEEHGLVMKSKAPKTEGKPNQDDLQVYEDSSKSDKPNDNRKHSSSTSENIHSKGMGDEKSKTAKEDHLPSATSKKEEKEKNKSSETSKNQKNTLVNRGDLSYSPSPKLLNMKRLPSPPRDETHEKVDTAKEPEQKPENLKRKVDEHLVGSSNVTTDQEENKTTNPDFCCQMNCNCKNRRGENHSNEPFKTDSMNQTGQGGEKPSCCKGCNCGQNSIPVIMNACMCRPESPTGGDMAMRPIFQIFTNPVPVPCKCQTRERTDRQSSKPATVKSCRGDSQEAGTQTSKPKLSKQQPPSDIFHSATSSSAPSQSTPPSSAPTSCADPTGPSGNTTSSSSEPTTSTSPSSGIGKSDSMMSCTCPTDLSKTNVKDVCTSDTNCCCPEKLVEVFQEFDDKYSQVVKEIKFLIREGYIPQYDRETHELNVSASRPTPKGTSTRTAICRCTKDSCKRCLGNPEAAFLKDPTYSKKGFRNDEVDDECEESFQSVKNDDECEESVQSVKPPNQQRKDDRDICEQPSHKPQYAPKDMYSELQKDIRDLKELVKSSKFGNCPCCKCETENTQREASGVFRRDNNIQKNVSNIRFDDISAPTEGQPSEPSYYRKKPGRANEDDGSQKNIPNTPLDKQKEPSLGHVSYLGSTASRLRNLFGTESRESKEGIYEGKEETSRTAILTDDYQFKSTTVEQNRSEVEQEYRHSSQDPAVTGTVSSMALRNYGKSKGLEQGKEPTITSLPNNLTGQGLPGDSHTGGSGLAAQGSTFASPLAKIRGFLNNSNDADLSGAPNSGGSKQAAEGSTVLASPSISKSLEKAGDKVSSSKTYSKTVVIEDPSKNTSGTAGTVFGLFDNQAGQNRVTSENDYGTAGKPSRLGPEQQPQKSGSSDSKISPLRTTSSGNLVLSPEHEALFQSRERLRGYNSRVQVASEDDNLGTWDDGTERQCAKTKIPKMPSHTTEDSQQENEGKTGGRTRTKCREETSEPDKITGGRIKTGITEKTNECEDKRITGGKTKTEKVTSDETVSSCDDSVDDSSGESTTDACKTMLEIDRGMPCRFWSDETSPTCHDLDTYVMVVETESSKNDLTTREFVYCKNIPIKTINKLENACKVNDSELLQTATSKRLTKPTAFLASKGTSTIWKRTASPIGIIKGLCTKPEWAACEPNEQSTIINGREFSRTNIQEPSKKLVSPLKVSRHYSRISFRMPKSRDRKRRSAGDVRTCSSESFGKKNGAHPSKTEDKEVQVTKWNAMTQTAGPRKFNRTDISKEIEDKLARYLGLERTVEETSFSLSTPSTSEDHRTKRISSTKNITQMKNAGNIKKHRK